MTDAVLHNIDHLKLINDILIQSDTKKGALKKTEEVLERCRQYNVTLSSRKLNCGQTIYFAGFVVDCSKGTPQILQDPKKTQAIYSIDKDTVFIVDGSRLYRLGWCLVQQQADGSWKLIACRSQALTKAEARWSVFEIELLALKFALLEAAFWLRVVRNFKVYSDHRALVGIENRIMTETTSERIRKMVESVAIFDYTVVYMKGC